MRIASRIRGWLRKVRQRRSPKKSRGPLREFVYLDEVSVYSILASRKGGIATEFIERQTASLNSDSRSSLGVGFGVLKTKLDSKMQTGHVQASQVLSKAVIQTSFKELYDIEQDTLAMRRLDSDNATTHEEITDIEERLEPLIKDGWIVDPSAIDRGELLEAEVELEADPIFRMASVITILRELMEDNERLFGHAITAQLPEMSSVAQVLESLLVGLVPIRGRLVDYKSARLGGRDMLVHQSILEQMPDGARIKTCSAFVVGVTQRDLFWKDIRRVLFSGARYTVFCRLGMSGLADKWHPVKVADVLAGIAPQFDELTREFSERTRIAMTAASNPPSEVVSQDAHTEIQVISAYVNRLVGHHNGVLKPDVFDALIRNIPRQEGWLSTVDGRRSVLNEVTRRVDDELSVETSGKVAYELRDVVLTEVGLSAANVPGDSSGCDYTPSTQVSREERFLDAEIVAIYW